MANPLKVLTALSASSGAAISGSDGLQVQQGNIDLNAAGAITVAGNNLLQKFSSGVVTGSRFIDAHGGTQSRLTLFSGSNGAAFSLANGTGTSVFGDENGVGISKQGSVIQIDGTLNDEAQVIGTEKVLISTQQTNGSIVLGEASGNSIQLTGSTATSGSLSVGGNGSLTVANGLTVSNGSVSLPAGTVANAALANSSVTVGSTAISLGSSATAIGGLTGLSGSSLIISGSQITASLGFSGNGAGLTNVAASTATTLATARDISLGGDVSAVTQSFNGSSNIVFDVQLAAGVVGVTELASGVAGNGLTGGNGSALAVGAGTHITVNADDVAVNTSTLVPAITASIFAGLSGDISVTNAGVVSIAANSVALGTDTTGDYVASVAATTNAGLTVSGTGEGASVTVGLKNADNLTSNKLLKWDDSGNQLANSSITDDGSKVELTTALTGTGAYFTGDLRVLGTASFGQLNVINQQSLNVGDKYIVLSSGSTDHAGLEGAGMLWGSGAVGGTLFPDANAHAAIVYRNSNDRLEIFPGLSSSYITGSELNISGVSQFGGGLRAKSYQDLLVSANSTSATGSVLTSSTYNARIFLGTNESADTIAVEAQALKLYGSAEILLNSDAITLGNSNSQVITAAGLLTASAGLKVEGTSQLSGAVLFKSDTQLSIGATPVLLTSSLNNLSGAFYEIASAVGQALGNTLQASSVENAYRFLRFAASASFAANNRVVIVLSRGGDDLGQNSLTFSDSGGDRICTGSAILNMSASSEEDLSAKLSSLAFDVSIRSSGSYTWTNDLVSVQIAPHESSSVWYPKFTIDAPGLGQGNGEHRVRLVAVNEKGSNFIV